MTFDTEGVRERRERMLLRLLFRVTHSMNAAMVERVRAEGHTSFQASFTSLLAHVDTAGTSVSELARRMGVTRQAVSQLARAVEAAGLAESVPHPTDGRSILIRHTEAGREVLLDALDAMTELEDEYARLVGRERLDELKCLLSALLAEIDPAGGLRAG